MPKINPFSKSALDTMFDNCIPGDTRMKFIYFPPNPISFVGLYSKGTVYPFDYNNKSYGRISFLKSSFFTLVKEENESQTFFATIVKFCFSILLIFGIIIFSKKGIQKPLFILAAGIFIFFIRALIWNVGHLNIYLWFSILACYSYHLFKYREYIF